MKINKVMIIEKLPWAKWVWLEKKTTSRKYANLKQARSMMHNNLARLQYNQI